MDSVTILTQQNPKHLIVGSLATYCLYKFSKLVYLFITDTPLKGFDPKVTGPPAHRLIGCALSVDQENPLSFFWKWARQYGDVTRYNLLGERAILVADPESAKDVFTNLLDKPPTYKLLCKFLGETSLVCINGNEWKMR